MRVTVHILACEGGVPIHYSKYTAPTQHLRSFIASLEISWAFSILFKKHHVAHSSCWVFVWLKPCEAAPPMLRLSRLASSRLINGSREEQLDWLCHRRERAESFRWSEMSRATTQAMFFEDTVTSLCLGSKCSNLIPLLIFQFLCGENSSYGRFSSQFAVHMMYSSFVHSPHWGL